MVIFRRWVFRISVRTLSRGAEHPQAASPTFDATASAEYDMAPKLRVWGSRVAVVNHSVGSSAIYDWRTGELELVSSTSESRAACTLANVAQSLPHENVFVFLPPDKLIVYTARRPTPQTTENFLALHSLSSRTPSIPTHAFHLPVLAPYYSLAPARPPTEIDALAAPRTSTEPFSPDPAARALAFHLTLTHTPPDRSAAVHPASDFGLLPSLLRDSRAVRLVFLARAFLAPPAPPPGTETLAVPWSAWSAHAQFEHAGVEMDADGRVDSFVFPEHLCTVDFWPPRVRRAAGTENTRVVREPAVLEGAFFAGGKDVATCLPRVVRLRKLPRRPRWAGGARAVAHDAVVDVAVRAIPGRFQKSP
jgi:hypothetical protein